MVFSEEGDARRVREVLPKRLGRYGLSLHPEKTRLVRFKRPSFSRKGRPRASIDFLGFTLFWGRSRRGWWALKVKTASGRFTRGLRALKEWMARVRHWPVEQQAAVPGRKLLSHCRYYGVPGNSSSITSGSVGGRWGDLPVYLTT